MGQLIGFIATILAGGLLLRFFVAIFIYGTIYDFGVNHGFWGVAPSKVELQSFQLHDTNDYRLYHPYASGIIQNNSDKTLTGYNIKVDYYRCSVNLNNMNDPEDLSNCNQVWSKYKVGEGNFQVNLGIPPHTHAKFKLEHTLSDFSELRTDLNQDSDSDEYYIKYVPRLINVW